MPLQSPKVFIAHSQINTQPETRVELKHLKLTNFRCFNDFAIDFNPRLTVLVSKNGGGKSSILDAVAVGLAAFLTRLPKVSGINTKEHDFRVET